MKEQGPPLVKLFKKAVALLFVQERYAAYNVENEEDDTAQSYSGEEKAVKG